MWFIGVEVEQETSAPPPKKILDPPLDEEKSKTKVMQNLGLGKQMHYGLCGSIQKV